MYEVEDMDFFKPFYEDPNLKGSVIRRDSDVTRGGSDVTRRNVIESFDSLLQWPGLSIKTQEQKIMPQVGSKSAKMIASTLRGMFPSWF